MRYNAIASNAGNSIQAVEIEHGGHTTRWSMSTYTRFKVSDPTILFREVNAFWEKQPEAAQQRAWFIYWQMYRILDDPMNTLTVTLNSQLSENIGKENADIVKLYDDYILRMEHKDPDYSEHDYDNMLQREYLSAFLSKLYEMFTEKDAMDIVKNLMIVYASTMVETVETKEGVPNNYPDTGRTYTRSDYNNLTALAIRLRPMLPLFGQCMVVFQDRRKSSMKEATIVSLLNETDIFDMPAVPKLMTFMEASLKQFKATSTVIINGGTSTSGLVSWLTAKALFRRVAPGEIDSGDGLSSIVTNIFNFIERSVFESVNRTFGPVSTKKRPDDDSRSNGRSDDTQSLLETVNSREEITRGRRRMINVMAASSFAIAKRIDPTVDLKMVEEYTRLDPRKMAHDHHPVHEGLCRWVVSGAVPHHNLDYLRRDRLFIYLGITKAILEHWGFIEFAALMDAYPSSRDGIMPVASLWSQDSFSQEIVGQMVNMFPYEVTGGRKNCSIEERNVGLTDVRKMGTMISVENWVLNESPFKDRVNLDRDGFISFPPGFINQIGQLLIKCCSKTW